MKRIIWSLLICFISQITFSQNYYKSSYVPNVNQPTNSLVQQGWEYLETVPVYTYNGQSFVRNNLFKLRIYYKNLGNRTIFKATDGSMIYKVQTNPDYQEPNSLAARFEFYVVDMLGNYLFFNI